MQILFNKFFTLEDKITLHILQSSCPSSAECMAWCFRKLETEL